MSVTYKQAELNKALEVTRATLLRKKIRFRFCLLYLAAIAAIVAFRCKYAMQEGRILLDDFQNYTITVSNCTLNILDHQDPKIPNAIYMEYKLPRDHLWKKEEKQVEIVPDSFEISINNLQGSQRYCSVNLFVRPIAQSNGLFIFCTPCAIIQNTSSPLQLKELYITGTTVHINLLDVANRLFIVGEKGTVQVNNIEVRGELNFISLYEGDIIVQSREDFQARIPNYTNAFCLSANYVKTELAIEDDFDTYSMCLDETCNIAPNSAIYLTIASTGNIYANRIDPNSPNEGFHEDAANKSSIYSQGMGLSPDAQAAIDAFNSALTDPSKSTPSLMLDLGDKHGRSSTFTRWIVSASRSYALLRPWWLGTLSATLLDGYTIHAQGSLYPGLCPYQPIVTTDDLYRIQSLIQSKVNSKNAFVALIARNEPIDTSMYGHYLTNEIDDISGIFEYVRTNELVDDWISFSNESSLAIRYKESTYKDEPLVLTTVILSIVVAVFIASIGFSLTRYGIASFYDKLLSFSEHVKKYSNPEKDTPKTSQDPKKIKKKNLWTLFRDLLRRVPSLFEFIDYLVFIMNGQFGNSVPRFYAILFRKRTHEDSSTYEGSERIKFNEIKVLYEQFCFLNNLTERQLDKPKYAAFLTKYKHEIVKREEDQQTDVFTGINIKNYRPSTVEKTDHSEDQDRESKDSLDLFQANFTKTSFSEDQVPVEKFIQVYKEFCTHNKLKDIKITPELMKGRFEISTQQVSEQFLAKKHQNGYFEDGDDDLLSFLIRIKNRILFFWRSSKKEE